MKFDETLNHCLRHRKGIIVVNKLKIKIVPSLIAAIIGGLIGSLSSYLINEKNLAEAQQSQATALKAFTKQWSEENSRKDSQLNLMKDSIDEMRKAYIFAQQSQATELTAFTKQWSEENTRKDNQLNLMKDSIEETRKAYLFAQEKHRTEMQAIYSFSESNSANTTALIDQREKLSEEDNNRLVKQRSRQQKETIKMALINYIGTAEILHATHISVKLSGCSQVGNDQLVRTSKNGITSTSFYPNEAYDCSAKVAAEREMNSARAKFNAAMHVALQEVPKKDHNTIKRLQSLLDVETEKTNHISDENYENSIATLRQTVNDIQLP